MRKVHLFFRNIMIIIALSLLSVRAGAFTYTAVASGNFSDTATWGGAAPVVTTNGDIVIIPPGKTVILDMDFILNGILDLDSGVLVLNGHDLEFKATADLIVTGSGSIKSTIASNMIIRCDGLSGSLTFGAGSAINDLAILPANSISNVSLGSDIIVGGTLTLDAGTLSLGNYTLTFAANGNFSSQGTGTLLGTPASGLGIQTNGSITAPLRFSTAGNALNNLVINFPNTSDMVTLGSDVKVHGVLALSSGKLHAGTKEIAMQPGSVIMGGSDDSYVIATGGGKLTMKSQANTSTQYPVGTELHYCPVLIYANGGSATSFIGFSVNPSVLEHGYLGLPLSTTKPLVNATWFMTSTVTTGLDLNVEFSWNPLMEVNGFDRTQAYASQNLGGQWDMATVGPATPINNLYAISRNNITRPGPFAVADEVAALDVEKMINKTAPITLYPNPAVDVIHFTAPAAVANADVFDLSGRLVKACSPAGNGISISDLAPGYYNIRLSGKDFTAVQGFIKAE